MRPLARFRTALVSAAMLLPLRSFAQDRPAEKASQPIAAPPTTDDKVAQADKPVDPGGPPSPPRGTTGPNPVVTGGETPSTAAPGVPTPSQPDKAPSPSGAAKAASP